MPGPSSKKSKSKPKAAARPIPREPNDQIDNAEGWTAVIVALSDKYNVPDLTRRSGLKKVHADFDSIYRRLDKAYEQHKDNDKVTGGIVGIYAEMSVDVILRNKLFDKGFLKRMIPLLHLESTRHLVLRTLTSITHHSGEEVRVEVAREANAIAKTLADFPDDSVGAQLAVSILAHVLTTVVFFEQESCAPDVFTSLRKIPIIQAVTFAAKHHDSNSYLFDHATELICMATLNCTEACRSMPSTVKLMVCGLRSKDWTVRCTCLGGLIRLHRREAAEDRRAMDPYKLMAAVKRGFPPAVQDIMLDYGLDRCETVLMMRTTAEYQQAMMDCAQDHSLYRLGQRLAKCILQTEFSVGNGMFQTQNSRTGATEIIDVGLPFVMWQDALPHCAKALREQGDLDNADIVEIKSLVITQRLQDAFAVANKAIARNPKCAYFYYALSLSADPEIGLRSSKKGLKCKDMTSFVRFQLTQRAVEHAGELGIRKLQEVMEREDRAWQEGIAFLMSALEDSKVFIRDCPPDTRYLTNVLYWNILLRLTIDGPEMSVGLEELKTTRQKLKLADEVSTLVGMKPPNTYLRLTQATVLSLYTAAAEEWGAKIAMRDEAWGAEDDSEEQPHAHHAGCGHSSSTEDEIAAWVEGLQLDDKDPKPQTMRPRRLHPKINSNHVQLYRCSWCGNPSAILKKCSQCDEARYCDHSCQKSHWSDHKKACKTARTSEA